MDGYRRKSITSLILSLIFIFGLIKTTFAWSGSCHVYIAKKTICGNSQSLCEHNVKMGSILPDFFWYLRDRGELIDYRTVSKLHGPIHEAELSLDRPLLYKAVPDKPNPHPFPYPELRYFVEGINNHVWADRIADGRYIKKWVKRFRDILGEKIRDVSDRMLYTVIELAVDSLLIEKYGLQISGLIVGDHQVKFTETTLKATLEKLNFDVEAQYRAYLKGLLTIEKACAIYGGYLTKVENRSPDMSQGPKGELSKVTNLLVDAGFDLERYAGIVGILFKYPEDIYQVLTEEGSHWYHDVLPQVIRVLKRQDKRASEKE